MNWKEKIKWNLFALLLACLTILVVWHSGIWKEEKKLTQKEKLSELSVKENERAVAFSVMREEKPKEEETIRVLLMTDGYEGYYHSKISIKAQGDYEIQGGMTGTLSDGENLELCPENEAFEKGQIEFVPLSETNRLQVYSLSRGQGHPAYLGKITVLQDSQGLRIINELSLEQYLCGVVPSEMPSSYPMEALKAQAVCARTYAKVQMQGSRLEALGAQVDDSVAFQVYQNSKEAENSDQAVAETKGQILLCEGKPIHAYYFSTSHGKTSTDEVWKTSAPSKYLKSVTCEYDASEPWYQWSLILSRERLEKNTLKMFPEIGKVQGMEIEAVGEGGAVIKLVLHTDTGDKELSSEYDIRSLLAPQGIEIIRQDGSAVKGGALLPSAYFTIEEKKTEDGTFIGYKITGGGYGHGVGMSQNGAKGMANQGMTYEEILSYFYKDVTLEKPGEVAKDSDS